tara:strand:+ start:2068 stop:2901 length:834 start_codon:yes stop_codon:yes gene_type:complete
MSQTTAWSPVEGTIDEILEQVSDPLEAMRNSEIPCVIIRNAFPSAHCEALMERFYERGHLYDPREVGERTLHRVDIGTSLGKHANDPEAFYAHSQGTHELFNTLFEGYEDPVATLYESLQRLIPEKQVMVARDPDGRLYGPSIFRTYHYGAGHTPHYDSVSKRSKRYNFSVSRFRHQYAAVMCFQNSEQRGDTGEGVLYRAPMCPDFEKPLTEKRFREYAEETGIERVQVHLEPGDLYFFYSETIHEVPFIEGKKPRCVLASFIGYSEDDPEVYLWS